MQLMKLNAEYNKLFGQCIHKHRKIKLFNGHVFYRGLYHWYMYYFLSPIYV